MAFESDCPAMLFFSLFVLVLLSTTYYSTTNCEKDILQGKAIHSQKQFTIFGTHPLIKVQPFNGI